METANTSSQSLGRSGGRPGNRRNLLKDYYGLSATATAAQSTAQSAAVADPDPLDLNAKHFQPERFFKVILQEKNMQNLLMVQCEFINKIKQLDGDMKTLVYENYEKFISATDIIKEMKSNITSMESEMMRLDEQVTKIMTQSTGISSALSEKRKQMRDLEGRHLILKKLQFIFDLPVKLKLAMKQDRFVGVCRSLYRSKGVFNAYREMKALDSIEKECIEIEERVKVNVQGKLQALTGSDAVTVPTLNQLRDLFNCCLALGEDPRMLWKEFIRLGTLRLQKTKDEALIAPPQPIEPEKITAEGENTSSSPSSEDLKSAHEAPLSPFVRGSDEKVDISTVQESARPVDLTMVDHPFVHKTRNLNSIFLKEFVQFLDIYYKMFMTDPKQRQATKQSTSDEPVTSTNHQYVNVSGDVFSVVLTMENFKAAKADIDGCVRVLMHQYFNSIESFLPGDDAKAPSEQSFSSEVLIAILELVYRDLTLMGNSSDVASVVLMPRAMNLIGVFLNQIVQHYFSSVRKEFLDRLKRVNEVDSPKSDKEAEEQSKASNFPIFKILEDAQRWLTNEALEKSVQNLCKLAESDAVFMQNFSSQYREAVRGELQSMWSLLTDEMTRLTVKNPFRIAKSPNSSHNRAILVLVFSMACQMVASNVVPLFYREFTKNTILWPKNEDDPNARWNSKNRSSEPSSPKELPEIQDIQDRCKKAGKTLLYRFVDLTSGELSLMIRKSLETRNWITLKEPRRPSKLWEQILEDMITVDYDVSQLLSKESPPAHDADDATSENSVAFSMSKFSQGNQSAVLSNMQSQFSQRSSIFGRISHSGHTSQQLQQQNPTMNLIDSLFSEKVDIYGKIYPENRNGVLQAILKIILKTFMEIVRLRTFHRNGFQQIQVDVEFIRLNFWRFVSNEKQVNGFLDEIIQSTMGRSKDPVLMEFSVIEKILSNVSNTE